MMELLLDPNAWLALLMLASLEIVLGIDNLVFIAIVVDRLPEEQRSKGRTWGLGMALGTRLLLLFSLSFLMGLTDPLFEVLDHGLSGRDLILLFGGLFLLYKSTSEVHHLMNGHEPGETASEVVQRGFAATIAQIALIDIVFSLDSVITALGMAEDLRIMVTAVVISMAVMLAAAKSISEFIAQHPTFKVLALSFLVMIGGLLVAEAFHVEVPKGYIYFAMGFSIVVELLNMRLRRRRLA
jgi:predicted tellurium resistance membrane protein TerC